MDPGENPLQAKLDLLKEERKKLKEEAANEEAKSSEVVGQVLPLNCFLLEFQIFDQNLLAYAS